MPVLVDPETALPEKGRKMTPAQIIMLLLYPVIFVVGLTVGLVIGLKQGREQATAEIQNEHINSTVIPNANNVVNTNTVNANVNSGSLLNNSNQALSNGDYLLLDAATQAELNDQEQADKESKIDQSTSVTDIVRQKDLISIQYRLKAYFAIKGEYPSTKNRQIRLDRTSADTLYQELKDFYGGSYNEPIDPEYPDHYYGYTSAGTSYELTAWLVSKNRAFIIKE